MLIWVFLCIVVGSSLQINYVMEAFIRMGGGLAMADTSRFVLYPDWVEELHYAFFWFSAILRTLMNVFWPAADRRSYMEDLKDMITWVMLAHAVSVLILRMLRVPWWFAYPGSALVTVAAPVWIASLWRPRHLKRLESEQLSGDSIRKIAERSDLTLRFIRLLPPGAVFVVDNAVKNEHATCLFLHRRPRMERPGLREDLILQMPIDLKELRPIEDGAVLTRYLFYSHEEGVSAVHLDGPDLSDPASLDAPIDAFTLDKIDSAAPRHPSIEDAPLPLVVRDAVWRRVENAGSPKSPELTGFSAEPAG